MIIKLSPVFSDETLTLVKQGDILIINGEEFDFSRLLDGCTLPQGSVLCDSIVGDVDNLNGEIVLTIIMPHKTYASEESKFPRPLVNIQDGRVVLPTDFDVPHNTPIVNNEVFEYV